MARKLWGDVQEADETNRGTGKGIMRNAAITKGRFGLMEAASVCRAELDTGPRMRRKNVS
jgi:hypothetical protein